MNQTNKLYNQAISLPLEERAILADLILKSFNTPDYDNNLIWLKESEKRLNELRSGKVQPVPGHFVFKKIKDRFTR